MSEPHDRQTPADPDAPYDPDATQAKAAAATGPSEGSTVDDVTTSGSLWSDAWRELRTSPLFIVAAVLIVLMVLIAAFPQLFATGDPFDCSLSRSLQRPSAEHWFGTDLQGCDYYTRTIHGARASVVVALVTTAIASIIAMVLGTLAGYFGGWLDSLLSRITDVFFGVPVLLAAIVLLQMLPNRGTMEVALVLGVFGWPAMMRLMRSSVLTVTQADYVTAARALGANDARIMRRHILPNAIMPVLVYATIFIGIVIIAEASLTFLGVGLQLPAISWGLMISLAQGRLLQAPHLLIFPGAMLSITIFSFILMGDALRDAFDPKLR